MADVTKACTKCGIQKSLESFGPRKRGKDGLHPQCRECVAALSRARYERKLRARGVIPEQEWGERFLASFVVNDATGCWEWTGYIDPKGYGRIGVAGVPWRAHRISLLLHSGDLPAGCFVCHHCDNPKCVNPNHLYAGDIYTNNRDACERDRLVSPTGEDSGAARLTAAQVAELRAMYATGKWYQRALAAHFGISQSQVSHIVTRKHWKAA